MQHTLIYVVYDGLNNSVFAGQVLAPLLEKLNKHHYQEIIIISFEKQKYTAAEVLHYVPETAGLRTVIFKKYPFLGIFSLYPATVQLRSFLFTQPTHDLLARGPLAGYICKKATLSTTNSLTIQARGLLAAEYDFFCSDSQSSIKKLLQRARKQQLHNLEKKTYSRLAVNSTIEAVSDALKDYLVKELDADTAKITIAQQDIPTQIAPAQLAIWRSKIRGELGIAADTKVYCYNGSIKPWQCPDKVISFFKSELEKNKDVFLFVLTQDKKLFEQELKKRGTAQNAYRVCSVPHKLIYTYLAACDVGLIFRQSHIVNWTSRPTKVLEYQAAGLPIIHNNTVAWIVQLPNTHEILI